MLFTDSELVCPRGRPGQPPWVIDIRAILASEKRQDEVATVNKFKAPELLAEYNRTWRTVHKLITELSDERNAAEKTLSNRRSILLLEVIPERLNVLDVPNTKEYREAIINLDPEATAYQDVVDQISAALEYFRGKLKSFENAYMSVKKIMSDDSFNMSIATKNPNLSGDATPSIKPSGLDATSLAGRQILGPGPLDYSYQGSTTNKSGWGKAKY